MWAIISLRGFEEGDERYGPRTASIKSLESNTTSSNCIEQDTSLLLTAKCKTNQRQKKLMDTGEGRGSRGALMPSYTTDASRWYAQGTKASRCLWVRSIERERLYILYTSSHKVQCLCLSLNKYCILLPPNSPNPFDLVHVCALTDLIKKDPHPPPKKRSYLLLNTCFFLFLAWWKGENM